MKNSSSRALYFGHESFLISHWQGKEKKHEILLKNKKGNEGREKEVKERKIQMSFVLTNIERGTELTFCIIEHAMCYITDLRAQ